MAYDAQYLICCMVRDVRQARKQQSLGQHPGTLAEYAARHLFDECNGRQRHGACYASKGAGVTALGVLQFFALSNIAGGSAELRHRWHQWTSAPRAKDHAVYDAQSRAALRANGYTVFSAADQHVRTRMDLAAAYTKVAASLAKRTAVQQ